MKQEILTHRFKNGLTLIGEPIEGVSSAAFSVLIPCGVATDPEDRLGCSSVLCEMYLKGAGPYDSRELSQEFEKIGVQKAQHSGVEVTIMSGAVLGENLLRALELLSHTILEPKLPEEELPAVKQLLIQELQGLEDEPASRAMVELAKQYYPEPFGRCQLGSLQGIEQLTIDELNKYYLSQVVPNRSIIGVAGNFQWDEVKEKVGALFGSWKGETEALKRPELRSSNHTFHLERDLAQVQIALAYPSVSLEHKDFYRAKMAVSILSGGMAGRLFIEVREKRGLVYRVSASHSAARGRAGVLCFAGTTPENAEETLQVMMQELKGVSDGITQDELERARADLKSKVLIHLESSSVRASRLVNDWWNLGRVRTVDETRAGLDAVSIQDIKDHMSRFPVSPITLVTLGKKALEIPA